MRDWRGRCLQIFDIFALENVTIDIVKNIGAPLLRYKPSQCSTGNVWCSRSLFSMKFISGGTSRRDVLSHRLFSSTFLAECIVSMIREESWCSSSEEKFRTETDSFIMSFQNSSFFLVKQLKKNWWRVVCSEQKGAINLYFNLLGYAHILAS